MSIKRHLTACALGISVVFSVAALPLPVQAVELVRWERIPLPVSLHVGEERIVFVEKNVRVGFPPSLNEKLRIQSTGGAVYLRAESAFPQTRLQLQDVESGEILLLDVTATAGKGKLEPVRVVYSGEVSTQRDSQSVRRSGQAAGAAADAVGKRGPQSENPLSGAVTGLTDPLCRPESVCTVKNGGAGVRRTTFATDLTKNTDSTLPV